jgi:hypothetical protein
MVGGCVLMVGIMAWRVAFAAKPTVPPALSKAWHQQIYSLDEGETVRFVPPPYTPERIGSTRLSREMQLGFEIIGDFRIYQIGRESLAPWQKTWRDSFINWGGNWWLPPRPVGNLEAALEFAALGRWPDVVVADELKDVAADGDWIVRGDTPTDQRMMALQSVLKFVTGRDLVIGFEMVEHEIDDWELTLEERGPLKVIKDRQLDPGIVMRERKAKAQP